MLFCTKSGLASMLRQSKIKKVLVPLNLIQTQFVLLEALANQICIREFPLILA